MAKPRAGSFVRIEIYGNKELNRAIKTLPAKIQKKVLRQGIRAGMKIVKKQAEANVPRGGGGVARDSLIVRAWKTKRRGSIALEVRYDTDPVKAHSPKSPKYPDGFFYPAVLEYGSIKLNRPALAPIGNAYRQAGPPARDAAIRVIEAGVKREINTLRSK